jgi:hypothetical protein
MRIGTARAVAGTRRQPSPAYSEQEATGVALRMLSHGSAAQLAANFGGNQTIIISPSLRVT